MTRSSLCLAAFLSAFFLLAVPVVRSRTSPPQNARMPPTFTGSFEANGQSYTYTFAGQKPESGATTTIPTVVVPLALTFEANTQAGASEGVTDVTPNVPDILRSPIFKSFPFATGNTQYGDAVQRAQFSAAAQSQWHTLLGQPRVLAPIHIYIPIANGYMLHSRRTGKSLAIADLDFVQQQLFTKLANSGVGPGSLLIAFTKNIEFYSLGDATVCCSVGTHGTQVDSSGSPEQAFVIGSYFEEEVVPRFADVQAIAQQVAEWMNDPLHGYRPNKFPAWLKPDANGGCGGTGESSSYLMEQPADFLPASNAAEVTVNSKVYHLENIALLPWFEETTAAASFQKAYSFPDTKALPGPAQLCSNHRMRNVQPTAQPIARTDAKSNGHALIGYWEGSRQSEIRRPCETYLLNGTSLSQHSQRRSKAQPACCTFNRPLL